MNRMERIWFTRNRQNTRSFRKFLAGNPTRLIAPVAAGTHGSSQVTSAMVIPVVYHYQKFPEIPVGNFRIVAPCLTGYQ